ADPPGACVLVPVPEDADGSLVGWRRDARLSAPLSGRDARRSEPNGSILKGDRRGCSQDSPPSLNRLHALGRRARLITLLVWRSERPLARCQGAFFLRAG